MSRLVSVSVCLSSASCQLLRNCTGEKPACCSNRSTSQRIKSRRTRPTYWDAVLKVAVSRLPPNISKHTLMPTHSYTIQAEIYLFYSRGSEFCRNNKQQLQMTHSRDPGVTVKPGSRPWIDFPLFCLKVYWHDSSEKSGVCWLGI